MDGTVAPQEGSLAGSKDSGSARQLTRNVRTAYLNRDNLNVRGRCNGKTTGIGDGIP